MAKAEAEIVIEVKVNMSLWDAIKCRIAGIPSFKNKRKEG
jgi:hypothetical protein